MRSNMWDQETGNNINGNAPGIAKKTQLQQLDRGWRKEGCGANDALLKPSSTASDSAARFLRTVSSRLTTHAFKSQLNDIKKAIPFNIEDQHTAFNRNVQTTLLSETGTGFHTGNGKPTPASETRRGLHTGNDQTTPSSETRRGFSPRSLSTAPFFRRVQSVHHNVTVEPTQTGKEGFGNPQGTRLTPDKDETDSGGKKNSIFQRLGSLRIRKRTTVEYKSFNDGNQPLGVDTDRRSFRHKLRKDIRLPVPQAKEIDSCVSEEPAGPSGLPREIRGSISDGEEDESEDTQSSTSHRKRSFMFQRSSAAWRSFSAKSRTRSNDVLLERTERKNDIVWQKEELELELKLLSDIQQHLVLFGEQNGSLHLLTHNRRHFGFSKAASQSSKSCIDANGVSVSPSSSTPTKNKIKMLGFNDAERYRHMLDCLHQYNMAHKHSTEAAFVLCEHAQLCISAVDGSRLPEEGEEKWRRGEELLLRALEQFDLGKTWEYAIDICERLSKIYKAKFMYAELSKLLQKQANLYRKILQEPRTHPWYYMVHFVGKDFPDFLRNKRFVLRAERLENEAELSRIISDEFKGVLHLSDNMEPHETVATDNQRGFKLFKLKPVPSVSVLNLGSRKVPDAVQFFHRFNNISSFEVVENCEGESKTVVSIDSSLPTISRWAQVKTRP